MNRSTMQPRPPLRVGILGATGIVGQHLIARLDGHPWFRTSALGASERSAGRSYGDAARWVLAAPLPETVARMQVRRCDPEAFGDCDLVMSALDRPVAEGTEPAFVGAGLAVISNSSAYRMAPEVPLVVPEVNAEHLRLLERRDGPGFLVTNPNCSVAGLVLALAPLHRAFGVRRVIVSTLQALSGAGVDGPSALEMLDNVLPFIPGEEEKLETELDRLLGSWSADGIEAAGIRASAHCHRVGTLDGHLEAVSVELGEPVAPEQASETMSAWRGDLERLRLPSAPERPLIVSERPDRPQPRLDRDAGDGMSAVVGRVRACPVLGLRFVVLSHNAVRGAAGGALLNAELVAARGLLDGSRP